MADIGMDVGSGDRVEILDYREVTFDDVAVYCSNGTFRIEIDNGRSGKEASMKFKDADAFSAFIRACQWVRAKVDAPL
jgi:hypothetical protein